MDNQEQPNPFDEIGFQESPEELKKMQAEAEVKRNRYDYLIHKVFKQSDEGQELLALWQDEALLQPITGVTEFDRGRAEGMKQFIRNIIITVRKVEKNG